MTTRKLQGDALSITNAIIAARDIATAIVNAEGQVLSRTADLAEQYTVIVDASPSMKAAARQLADAGLPYANHANLRQLLRWHELVVNIAHEAGGNYSCPPFSEGSVRSILIDRYWNRGPGELAGIWLSQPWPTITAYVRHIKDRFKPQPRQPLPVKRGRDQLYRNTVGQLSTVNRMVRQGTADGDFAEALRELIEAAYGSVTKWQQALPSTAATTNSKQIEAAQS